MKIEHECDAFRVVMVPDAQGGQTKYTQKKRRILGWRTVSSEIIIKGTTPGDEPSSQTFNLLGD